MSDGVLDQAPINGPSAPPTNVSALMPTLAVCLRLYASRRKELGNSSCQHEQDWTFPERHHISALSRTFFSSQSATNTWSAFSCTASPSAHSCAFCKNSADGGGAGRANEVFAALAASVLGLHGVKHCTALATPLRFGNQFAWKE